MQSVLEEILKLRNGAPIIIDYNNSNRYRLVVQENNGSRTAYYFSTPIYNSSTRKMIDVTFQSSNGVIYATGSNSIIKISENVLMQNTEGSCAVDLQQKPTFVSSQEVHCGDIIMFPTANGVALKCNVKSNDKISFILDVEHPFLNVRANDKCFSLMKAQFRPFVVFSCIGSLDTLGNVIAPAKIEYEKLTGKKYRIVVSATSPLAQYVLFEANLYENKLFQDTTVESMNPLINNAFGSVGFIGNTSMYGEQWMYSKLDYSKIPEIMDKKIQKIVLHMPKLNQSKVEVSACKVSVRFCSFGSNWNNKVTDCVSISDSLSNSDYQSIDITSSLVEQRSRLIMKSEGLILKPKVKDKEFSVVSTGDSCLAPQIMEINFR